MSGIIAHCPKCGGTDIREKNVAYAEFPVLTWTLDDGIPTPLDVDDADSRDAEWEVADVTHQYRCANRRCLWSGNLDALVVEREPDEDDGR